MSSEAAEAPPPKHLLTKITETARQLNYLRHPDRPAEGESKLTLKADAQRPSFDVNEPFSLLVWNIHKGRGRYGRGWRSEAFEQITEAKPDIALLQEYMDGIPTIPPNFLDGHDATMAVGFYGKPESKLPGGVCTMSKVQAQAAEVTTSDHNEKIGTRTPKTALFTTYEVAGLDKKLGVINLHQLLSASPQELQAFLDKLDAQAGSHDGPLIFAGDFNTWSAKRVKIVEKVMEKYGLHEVEMPGATYRPKLKPLLRRFALGRQSTSSDAVTAGLAMDRIYVRGLSVTDRQVLPSTASDHKPLLAQFTFEQ